LIASRRLLALEMHAAEMERPVAWFRAEDYNQRTGTWLNVLADWVDDRRDGETLVGMIRREVLDRFRSNRPCLWREANP
jgi:hypothetical protein